MSAAPDERAPAPSPALLAAVAAMKPVHTRVPWRALAAVVAAGALVPALKLARGMRPDLDALPAAWVAGMGLLWAAGLLAPLLLATLPRRGAVLPDAARAGRAALIVAAGLLLLGLFATVDAPGRTVVAGGDPGLVARLWWHCIRFELLIAVPLLLAGGLALRGIFPMGGVRIAAALGAAGGALGGLTLHLTCPVGGGLHVGLAHAGGVVLGALMAILVLPRVLRLRP